MRCAVIITDSKNSQVLGITSDEAQRIGKAGTYEHKFGEYTLRFVVDVEAEPLTPATHAPIDWPEPWRAIQDNTEKA